jgi:hypothetical protein
VRYSRGLTSALRVRFALAKDPVWTIGYWHVAIACGGW